VARLYYSLIEYFKFFSNTLLSNKKKKRREQRREMSKDFWERKRKGTRGERERERAVG
jgi:hypothetical protein